MIGLEASWVEDWKKTQQGAATGNAGEPSNLLAPLAKMLESRGPRGSLSAAATRALLASVGSRPDEARDIPRYLLGLMVFLGLLGHLWGLLQPISPVVDTHAALPPTNNTTPH